MSKDSEQPGDDVITFDSGDVPHVLDQIARLVHQSGERRDLEAVIEPE